MDKLRNPPPGKRYQECFDMASGKPNKEFIELYHEVRREMTDKFGLKLPLTSPYI